MPTVPGTGGYYAAGYTGTGGGEVLDGWQSPTYILTGLHIPIGSTIFFGTLDLSWVYVHDQYGDEGYFMPKYSINGPLAPLNTLGPRCNFLEEDSTCGSLTKPPNIHVDLLTTYDDPYLQFSYAQGTFTPAVPEPSTWVLLLIGFIALGFADLSKD